MGTFQKYKFKKSSFMDKPNYKSVGYARVSTPGQMIESQVADLMKARCCIVFKETISTRVKEKERP